MLSTREYSCPRYGKRMKSINKLTKHINMCISHIIQYGLSICIQPKQNMPIAAKDNNALDYLGPYKKEE